MILIIQGTGCDSKNWAYQQLCTSCHRILLVIFPLHLHMLIIKSHSHHDKLCEMTLRFLGAITTQIINHVTLISKGNYDFYSFMFKAGS